MCGIHVPLTTQIYPLHLYRSLAILNFCLEQSSTVEPHYNGTEGTDCIFALLPKSGVAIWAISVKKKHKKAEEKNFFYLLLLARYPIVR